ncbi:MAG: flagellar basal body P-ring formation protein FlgA [Acidobacteria bacterium]|nr:flagellar basal body P-ring formation protein FlgA [Acidobacteriota bacterium]
MILVWCLSVFSLSGRLWGGASPTCLPVSGDSIQARHLSASLPEFNSIAPDTIVLPAPLPGVVRTLHPDEARRIGRLHGVTLDKPETLCFAVPMTPLKELQIQQAMQRELGRQTLQVDILDFSKVHVPDGELVFPRNALSPPANGDVNAPLTWRGYIQYSAHRRFTVWARVRVWILVPRVVVTAPVKAGETIQATHLSLEVRRTYPFEPDALESPNQAVGMIARRSLVPGSTLSLRWIAPAVIVQKGETVRVETRVGAARLVLQAVAETSGRLDGTILVRNPTSGRSFQARVVGQGQVQVGPSGYAHLMHNEKR